MTSKHSSKEETKYWQSVLKNDDNRERPKNPKPQKTRNRLIENIKNIAFYGSIAMVGLLIVWYLFVGYGRGKNWYGDGSINVFPSSSEAKNYRLDASMDVTIGGATLISNHKVFSNITGYWPDGGELDLTNCFVVEHESSRCQAKDGRVYTIEIETAPDAPESDMPDPDYNI